MLAKTKDFLNEVKAELEKVTWPARKETIGTTWVVVAIIVLIAFFLGGVDLILNKIVRFILR